MNLCSYDKTCETNQPLALEHKYETNSDGDKICTTCGYIKEHSFATTYEFDAISHWHPASCGHNDQTSGNASHTFVENGAGSRRCSVCGYEEGHIHTFATAWTSNSTEHWHVATCGDTTKTSGNAPHSFVFDPSTSSRRCSVCSYSEAHTHKFATAYSYDASYHWHEATCGDTTEKGDLAEHNFSTWSFRNELTGNKTRTCYNCKYVQVDHEHTYTTATWTQGETTHYHKARCEHSELKIDEAEHEYVDQGEPDSNGMVTLKCRVCDKEITEHRHSWEIVRYITEVHTTRDQGGRRTVKCSTCNEEKDEDYRIEIPSRAPKLASLGGLTSTSAPSEYTAINVPVCVPGANYYTFGVFPMTEKAAKVTVDENIICLENEDFDYCLGDDYNWYYKRGDTWYKVEPIKWREVSTSDGRLLIAEKVLSAGHTNSDDVMDFFNGARSFVGNGFYQMAFTEAQKSAIKTITIENEQRNVFLPNANLCMAGGSISGSKYATRAATDFAISMGAMKDSFSHIYCDYWVLPGVDFNFIQYIGSVRDSSNSEWYHVSGPRTNMDSSLRSAGKYGEVPALVLND